MALVENYEMLPRRSRLAIKRMLRARGIEDPSLDQLAEEAFRMRVEFGWFVWECPSTARKCRERKRRIAIPDNEVPVFPEL